MAERAPLGIEGGSVEGKPPSGAIIIIAIALIVIFCVAICFLLPVSQRPVEKQAKNNPPTADFTYTPEEPVVASPVKFIDRSNDLDGQIVNYSWNFGDGNVSYEIAPSHLYPTEGTYNVNLTVKDNAGAINSKVISIIVKTYYQFKESTTIEGSQQNVTLTSKDYSFDVYPNATQLSITVTYNITQPHVIELESQINVHLFYSAENDSVAEDTESGLNGTKTVILTGDQILAHGYGKWGVLIHHYSDMPTDNVASYTITIRVDYR